MALPAAGEDGCARGARSSWGCARSRERGLAASPAARRGRRGRPARHDSAHVANRDTHGYRVRRWPAGTTAAAPRRSRPACSRLPSSFPARGSGALTYPTPDLSQRREESAHSEEEPTMPMPYRKYRPYETVELPDRTLARPGGRARPDLVLDRPARRQPGARQADGRGAQAADVRPARRRSASRRSRSASPRPRRPTSTSCARSSRRAASPTTRRSPC